MTGNNGSSTVPIKDKNEKALSNTKEQKKRWMEYFQEVLNQPSAPTLFNFNEETSQKLPINIDPISEDEVERVIQKLKSNKSAGADQIVAEMLKYGGVIVLKSLTQLLNCCWNLQRVPDDWRHGVIVKLPKKGNLLDCNNWRGVTPLL